MKETIVLTSINPYSKVDYQKKCFERWNNLGFLVRTFNNSEEKKNLISKGFNTENIIEIHPEETALGLWGKACPRIVPILHRALHTEHKNFILVNSDIYPAIRKCPIEIFRSISEQIAFTRNQLTYIEYFGLNTNSPYRGGLDIFFFTKEALLKVYKLLRKSSVSERMTFGIPGWDFYLAERMLTSGNLEIMDSFVFLHEYHKTTYDKINEFENYSRTIAKTLNWENGEDWQLTAEKFSEFITTCCGENQKYTEVIRKTYSNKIGLFTYYNELEQEKASAIYNLIINKIDKEDLSLFQMTEKLQIFILRNMQDIRWDQVVDFINDNMTSCQPKYQRLISLYILLLILEYNENLCLSMNYPKESLHGVTLKEILKNLDGQEQKRDLYIFDLFANELLEYGILNNNLLDFLFYSFRTEQSFKYLVNIKELVKNYVY